MMEGMQRVENAIAAHLRRGVCCLSWRGVG